GDIAEEQAAGERARTVGRHVHDRDLTATQTAQQGNQRGQVVDVLQALADGLQHDGERRVLGGDLEQLRAALALLPQGAATAGVSSWEQQSPGGALTEPA